MFVPNWKIELQQQTMMKFTPAMQKSCASGVSGAETGVDSKDHARLS